MATLTHTERAQLTNKGSEYAAIHSLTIGGEDFSNRLLNASFAWTADGAGGSNMDFEVEGSLQGMSDAPVVFKFGYGRDDVRTYFRGRLAMPQDNPRFARSTAVAFGPFRLLTDTFLRNTMSYQGKNLEYVMTDLSHRAEYPSGGIVVLGGKKYNVPAGELYSMGTSLQEVASSILEKAKYVAFDIPGGKRVIMPTPKPGSNGSIKAVYAPRMYKEFTTEPNTEVAYHSVVVYRNDSSTWGGGAVYAERAINPNIRYKPPKSRVYYVPDFPGTNSQAHDEAMRLAQVLRDGEMGFTMTLPFNRAIALYDGFRAISVKQLGGGMQQRQVFICTVDKDISVTYSPGNIEMVVSGKCYEVKNERLEIDTRYEKRATSYGVVLPTEIHTALDDAEVMDDTDEMYD